MLPITGSSDLDTFVKDCDAAGGIGSPAAASVIDGFSFDVDKTPLDGLDPRSPAYLAFQDELYHLLAGRHIDQTKTEDTIFDIDFHAAGANPYNNITPSNVATHLIRLLSFIQIVEPPNQCLLLDFGAGWGLSSEVCAYTGMKVTAVDINEKFVELIRRRAARSGLPIKSVAASFEQFEAEPESYDIALFYECLHHAVQPWVVLERVARMLKPGGRIGLVNEPINQYWWPHWGLRLDALSVYCIRKFGWFESGWSMPFIKDCLDRAGFDPEVVELPLGPIVVGRKR